MPLDMLERTSRANSVTQRISVRRESWKPHVKFHRGATEEQVQAFWTAAKYDDDHPRDYEKGMLVLAVKSQGRSYTTTVVYDRPWGHEQAGGRRRRRLA